MLEWLFGKKKEETKPVKKEKKQKKSEAEQETEDRWQYEFLLQFLNSPLWRVSVLDFVDQNCIVFDSEEENKFSYTKIHNEFKELVGTLFDGMMQEIGLDEEKLVTLLEKGFTSKEHKLFDQLLLCDDFLKFKKMMVKRNQVLENEALRAMNGETVKSSRLQEDRNIIRESMREQEERKKHDIEEEEETLKKVLELSLKEAEEKQQIEELELRASKLESEESEKERKRKETQQKQEQIEANQRKQEEERQKQTEQERHTIESNKSDLPPIKNTNLSDLPPLRPPVKKEVEINKEQQKPIEETKPIEKVHQEEIEEDKGESAEERKKRLLEQREKIRKKKEEERKKMLEEEESFSRKTENIVLQDSGIHDTHSTQDHTADEKISKEEIERRKEIMKKIKNRIVDDF